MTAPRKGDKEGLFTYGEYRSWPDDERWELIDGVAFAMSPAPSRRHQGILTEIAGDFVSFFRSRPCEVYVSPFDVVLPDTDTSGTPEESDTVVQPDLVVVCDSSILVYTIESPEIEGDVAAASPLRYRRPILCTTGESISPAIFPDLLIDLDRVLNRDR